MTEMNDYMRFIATSRYARWLPDKGRRETWAETVSRYVENVVSPAVYTGNEKEQAIIERLEQSIVDLEVMPSMRAMMTAVCGFGRCDLSKRPKSTDKTSRPMMVG